MITIDKGVRIDGANLVKADIACSNGIIHVIDRVILPSTDDLIELAAKAGSFETLAEIARRLGRDADARDWTRRSDELDAEWGDVNMQLAQLADLHVVPGDKSPADLEDRLLQRLDEIEYEAGYLWFLERDGTLPPGLEA